MVLAATVGVCAERPGELVISEPALAAVKLAKHHYGQSNYKEAARLFHQAYGIQPLADFLYNAARAEQRAFDLDAAEQHYEQVLKIKAVSPDVIARVRLHLRELRESRSVMAAREKALKDKLGAAMTPPSTEKAPRVAVGPVKAADVAKQADPSWRAPAGWAGIGLGTVALGVGGWMALDAMGQQEQLDGDAIKTGGAKIDSIAYADYRDRKTAIDGRIDMSRLLIGAGVALAGAGTWLLVTRDQPAQSALNVRVIGRGLQAAWHF